MVSDTERARDALYAIPPDLPRKEWVKVGMAAQAAGIDFETFNDWSARAGNYCERDARDTFRSFKPGKGVGAGTLFKVAAENGWHMSEGRPRRQAGTHPSCPPPDQAPRMDAADVWNQCQPATNAHPYIIQKQAVRAPLDSLRVLPAGHTLHICGEPMAGALVVPFIRTDGTVSSLQFIAPPDVAARLKAKGKCGKLNLHGATLKGWFTVGKLLPGGVTYIVEGIGAAWSCWQATGAAAVVCFGWGRLSSVAAELRARNPSAQLVIVTDVGKESAAAKVALDVDAKVVNMPDGWPQNSDVNDLAQRDGDDVLSALLASAKQPSTIDPRYKLLGAEELRKLPALDWRVRGVLPAKGLAALYGQSSSGKSFLGFDMATAIAEGRPWFGCRVEVAPVVYLALEGEAGFKLRVAAWEAHKGRALPANLTMVLQPFELTQPQDVRDLAAVVPAGAVLFIDTLNRAAPTADENSSKDMGEILSAAKKLQSQINGLVVLVHHTGKDATKGLRGHSSLFAALDAAVEVSRNGDTRNWKVTKTKDGRDGVVGSFTLQTETLGADGYGDQITSCVVLPVHGNRDVMAVKLPQGDNQRLILDALRPLFKAGELGKPGAPPLSACIELKTAIATASRHMTCETFRRATRAKEGIAGLLSRGVMGRNENWLWLAE